MMKMKRMAMMMLMVMVMVLMMKRVMVMVMVPIINAGAVLPPPTPELKSWRPLDCSPAPVLLHIVRRRPR